MTRKNQQDNSTEATLTESELASVNPVLGEKLTVLTQAFENAPYGIQVTDMSGHIVYANQAIQRIYGFSPDEQRGKHISAMNAEPGFADTCILPSIRSTGRWEGEVLVKHKDGRILPIWLATSIVKDDRGKPIALTGISRDITESKRVKTALVQSETKYRKLLELANDAIFLIDAETGILVEANQKASDLLGRPVEEIIGIHHSEIHPPDKLDQYEEEFQQHAGRGGGATKEVLVRHASGRDVAVEISSSVVELDGKKFMKGIFRDLTNRNRAKELSDSLNEISKSINSTQNVDEILNRLVARSAEAFGSETTALLLQQKSEWTVKCGQNLPAEMIGSCLSERQIPHVALAATTQNPVVINDLESEEHLNSEFMQGTGIRSTMVVPLIVKDVVIGCNTFSYHSSPITFTPDQIDFAVKLGAIVSLALENARLFSEQREARELSDALNDINSLVNSNLDFEQIMKNVVSLSTRAIGSETAVMAIRDKNMWELRYISGFEEDITGARFTDEQCPHVVLATESKKTVAIDDAYNDERVDVEVMKKYEVRSALVAPLLGKEEVIGALIFNYHSTKTDFSAAQIDFAEKLGTSISLALENARLFSEQQRIASTLQEALLIVPEELHHVEIGHLYRSATEGTLVGGDFYDFFELQGDRVGIVIGDVSGKGLKAATLTSTLKQMIKSYAYEGHSPGAIISKTNIVMVRELGPSTFVTAFMGVLDTQSGVLTYCCAGHPPPIIKRQNGDIEILEPCGPPIGVLDYLEPCDKQQLLRAGDLVTLYTDGVIEARCAGDMFGENRLIDFIRNTTELSAANTPKKILDKLTCCECALADDVAIVSLSLQN